LAVRGKVVFVIVNTRTGEKARAPEVLREGVDGARQADLESG